MEPGRARHTHTLSAHTSRTVTHHTLSAHTSRTVTHPHSPHSSVRKDRSSGTLSGPPHPAPPPHPPHVPIKLPITLHVLRPPCRKPIHHITPMHRPNPSDAGPHQVPNFDARWLVRRAARPGCRSERAELRADVPQICTSPSCARLLASPAGPDAFLLCGLRGLGIRACSRATHTVLTWPRLCPDSALLAGTA